MTKAAWQRGSAQDPHLLTSLARPTQDVSPEECVYTHDPTGLNVLKKGCAHYCNQTFLVSLGAGLSVPSDLGTCFSFGPRAGVERTACPRERCRVLMVGKAPRGLPLPLAPETGPGSRAPGR